MIFHKFSKLYPFWLIFLADRTENLSGALLNCLAHVQHLSELYIIGIKWKGRCSALIWCKKLSWKFFWGCIFLPKNVTNGPKTWFLIEILTSYWHHWIPCHFLHACKKQVFSIDIKHCWTRASQICVQKHSKSSYFAI